MNIVTSKLAFVSALLLAASACGNSSDPATGATGGAPGTSGGTSSGGMTTGGSSGGQTATGGAVSGGSSSGGTASGGTNTGGLAGGGASAAGGANGGTSTAGTSTGGGASGPMFTQVGAILQANCGSKCHSGMEEGLEHLPKLSNTDPSALYKMLTSELTDGICAFNSLLTAGNASSSLLVRAMKNNLTEPCVLTRMPAGCGDSVPCVSDADIAKIEAWINAGAQQNQ